MLVVEDVDLEGAWSEVVGVGVGVGGQGLGGRDPHVELGQPVLKRVHLQDATAKTE